MCDPCSWNRASTCTRTPIAPSYGGGYAFRVGLDCLRRTLQPAGHLCAARLGTIHCKIPSLCRGMHCQMQVQAQGTQTPPGMAGYTFVFPTTPWAPKLVPR